MLGIIGLGTKYDRMLSDGRGKLNARIGVESLSTGLPDARVWKSGNPYVASLQSFFELPGRRHSLSLLKYLPIKKRSLRQAFVVFHIAGVFFFPIKCRVGLLFVGIDLVILTSLLRVLTIPTLI